MQGRSWMAALTLAAATAATIGTASFAGQPTPIKQTVRLSLRIDGIKREGSVVVKPGHPGCRFRPVTEIVRGGSMINLPPIEVETLSADLDCCFAITLKEPGQPDKTVRRNLRIVPAAEGRPVAPQTLTCLISSNSLNEAVADKADETRRKK